MRDAGCCCAAATCSRRPRTSASSRSTRRGTITEGKPRVTGVSATGDAVNAACFGWRRAVEATTSHPLAAAVEAGRRRRGRRRLARRTPRPSPGAALPRSWRASACSWVSPRGWSLGGRGGGDRGGARRGGGGELRRWAARRPPRAVWCAWASRAKGVIGARRARR